MMNFPPLGSFRLIIGRALMTKSRTRTKKFSFAGQTSPGAGEVFM
jgi:hypothetical protein